MMSYRTVHGRKIFDGSTNVFVEHLGFWDEVSGVSTSWRYWYDSTRNIIQNVGHQPHVILRFCHAEAIGRSLFYEDEELAC